MLRSDCNEKNKNKKQQNYITWLLILLQISDSTNIVTNTIIIHLYDKIASEMWKPTFLQSDNCKFIAQKIGGWYILLYDIK